MTAAKIVFWKLSDDDFFRNEDAPRRIKIDLDEHRFVSQIGSGWNPVGYDITVDPEQSIYVSVLALRQGDDDGEDLSAKCEDGQDENTVNLSDEDSGPDDFRLIIIPDWMGGEDR